MKILIQLEVTVKFVGMKRVAQYKYMNCTADKLKALTLATVINYITNYVTTILLIILYYYLLALVANLSKQTHLERYVLVPLEQSLF